MKLLSLCLGLTLVCAWRERNDVVESNFDISKISGDWYSILLASDFKGKIEENGSFRISMEHISACDNSSLALKLYTKVNGECTEISLICDKAEEDDVYTLTYDGYNIFCILEVDYDKYIIFYLVNVSNNGTFHVLKLSARERDVTAMLKRKFVRICQKYGIVEENIVDLTKVDHCLQARESAADQASRISTEIRGQMKTMVELLPTWVPGLCIQ
uniref:Zinc finger protein 883 isoform X2 n=1 Tax=Camelus bactrianus TaxID=9837 RepID=A0A9W3G8F2_CAMBA|nr:allergen Fel d 4 isoform X1 [Camelus dromedarius]XP_045374240.1 zinc finger protein 883 isoform X2 [Camelus bactrianus]